MRQLSSSSDSLCPSQWLNLLYCNVSTNCSCNGQQLVMNQTIIANVMHTGLKGWVFDPKSQKSARGTRNGPLISYLGCCEQHVKWTRYVTCNMVWTIGRNTTVASRLWPKLDASEIRWPKFLGCPMSQPGWPKLKFRPCGHWSQPWPN